MRLFISHASEDKKDFVDGLIKALEETYEVWPGKGQLTLGDSLLAKINEGLSACDFGVVVLSPHFFAKKWPKAELDGLFSLETSNRKVILPIWKDLVEEDVKKYSLILAGRYAVAASDGLEKVVEAIRLAVDTSERQRQLTVLDSTSQRMKGLDETLTEQRESAKLLSSEEGARLVKQAQDSVFESTEKILSELSATSGVLKFKCQRHDSVTFTADTGFSLTLHLNLRRLADNSAASASFTICVFTQRDPWEKQFDILRKEDFAPSFRRSRQVVWKNEANDRTFSNEELVAHAIEIFRAEIERIATATQQK
jgi:hypothetical protein